MRWPTRSIHVFFSYSRDARTILSKTTLASKDAVSVTIVVTVLQTGKVSAKLKDRTLLLGTVNEMFALMRCVLIARAFCAAPLIGRAGHPLRCLRLAPYVRCQLSKAVFRFLQVDIGSIERILLPLSDVRIAEYEESMIGYSYSAPQMSGRLTWNRFSDSVRYGEEDSNS